MKNCLIKLWLVVLFAAVVNVRGAGEEGGKCDVSNDGYLCPNCGGYYVKDCLECTGYFNTAKTKDADKGINNNICFDRKIFNDHNDDHEDHDEYYTHLWRDIVGMCVWFCAAGIATACGVGGGGIYVPLGMIILDFAPKCSSGLSQASIFGASLGGILLNLRNNHPNTEIRDDYKLEEETNAISEDALEPLSEAEKKAYLSKDGAKLYTRPIIDYDMALFLAPMEMAGAVLGVLIQKLLPNWGYLTLSAIILGLTAKKTYTKWWTTREKEIALAKKRKEKEEGVEEPETADGNAKLHETDKTTGSNASDDMLEKRRELLARDARQYPMEKLIALIILWIGLIVLTFLKGGKGVDSLIGVTCADPMYSVLIALQFLWTFAFAVVFGLKLLKVQKEKVECAYPFMPYDVQWDFSKLRFYSFFTFLAGVVAGLIGIGGGMVLGPLMLIMGIHPRVSSATTATMIVLTSSSVAILFVTSGLVPWEYAITFFFTCFIGALIGKTKIDAYVKKTGKASLLIFMLATIIALATTGCIYIVIMRLHNANWCFAGFNEFCSKSEGSKDDADECASVANAVIANSTERFLYLMEHKF